MNRSNRLGITQRQSEVLSFIEAYTAERGYSPSYEEIGKAMGPISKSSVHHLVHGLVARGRIVLSNKSRSITVVGERS